MATPDGGWALRVLRDPGVLVGDRRATVRPRELDTLTALALCAERVGSVHELAAYLWRTPPATAAKSIHNHVARLRGALGRDAVESVAGRYRMAPAWVVDIDDLLSARVAARERATSGDHRGAAAALAGALAGSGTGRLTRLDGPAGVAARTRLDQTLTAMHRELVLALLEGGDAAEALVVLAELDDGAADDWTAVMGAVATVRRGDRTGAIAGLRARAGELRARGLAASALVERVAAMVADDDPDLYTGTGLAAIVANADDRRRGVAGDVIGRAGERSAIIAALDDALGAGASWLRGIAGPPGIGKSTLLRAVAMDARLRGWTVAEVACHRIEPTPLAPLDRVLARLGPEADIASASTYQRLVRLTGTRPTALLLDDADWLAPTARELIDLLAARGAAPLAVLLAGRSATRLGDVLVPLGPVGAAAAEQIVLQHEPRLSPPLVHEVVHRARGNPAMLLDLAATAGRVATVGPPAARAPFGAAAGRLLTATQVGGGSVGLEVLQAAAGDLGVDDVAAAVAALTAAGAVVVDEGAVTVADDLGSLVVETPSDADRAATSAALCRAAEATASSPVVIARLGMGSDLALERIADHVDAAVHELDVEAYWPEALELLLDAVELADARGAALLAERWEARALAIQARRRVGVSVARVRELLKVAERERPDVCAELAGAACWIAEHDNGAFTAAQIGDLLDRYAASAASVAVRVRAYCGATVYFRPIDSERCRRYFELGLAAARGGTADDLAEMLSFSHLALVDPADLDRRHELAVELMGLAERLDRDLYRLEGVYLLFFAQLQSGDPALRPSFRWFEQLVTQRPTRLQAWSYQNVKAAMAHLDGRLAEARSLAEEALAAAPVDPFRAYATYLGLALAIAAHDGREAELRPLVDAGVAQTPDFLPWRAAAAFCASAEGDRAAVVAASRQLDDGRAIPRGLLWMPCLYVLGRAVARAGLVEPARTIIELLLPFRNQFVWAVYGTMGPVAIVLAELYAAVGDVAAARELAADAHSMATRVHAPRYAQEAAALPERLARAAG